MKDTLKIIFFLLFFIPLTVHGQAGNGDSPSLKRFPVFFNQYFQCLSLLNPSAVGIDENIESSLGNQRITGYGSRYATSYFVVNKRLSPYARVNYPYSALGLYVYNDHEGKYINRGRAYLQYAWHARLGHLYNFSGGLKIGGVNYYVKLPDFIGGNATDYGVDGGASVGFYSEKDYYSFSFDQTFNAELRPLNELTQLAPFFTVTAFRNFSINEFLKLQPLFFSRYTLNNVENIYTFNLKADIKETFCFSGGFRNKYGLIFMAGVEDIETGNGLLTIGLSYVIPVEATDLNINIVELGINYNIKNKK